MSILEVNNLSISFQQYSTSLTEKNLTVISDLSVSLEAGKILAVVGASGSGKSLLAHAVLGILPLNAKISGSIVYQGAPLTTERQMNLRGKEIVFVPQSVNYLNPLMRVGRQVRISAKGKNRAVKQRRIFARYHLGHETEEMYPFQLSGGMARRVLLSTAMMGEAKVMIADEPTPGLDPIVIEEALHNIKEAAENGCAVMLITHDIESALKIADKIAVFYAGTVLEITPSEHFTGDGSLLRHPYSRALWRALPQNDFIPIPGTQPQPGTSLKGCVFAPRCAQAALECHQKQPEMKPIRNGMVRCIHAT
nr:ABC transporter ATP-binding protein [uncultured Bacillus sp.]